MNHLIIKNKKSKKIIVFFSGLGANIHNKFQWMNFSQTLSIDYNLIFFKDPTEQFYTKGIQGFSYSESDTADQIWKQGFYEEYNFIGSSMGGYGAIACAKEVENNFNLCPNLLVFNPYINIDNTGYKVELKKDLGKINFTKQSKRWCYTGGANNDIIQTSALKDGWVHKYRKECTDHNLAKFMRDDGSLKTAVDDFLEINKQH